MANTGNHLGATRHKICVGVSNYNHANLLSSYLINFYLFVFLPSSVKQAADVDVPGIYRWLLWWCFSLKMLKKKVVANCLQY